MMVHSVAEEQPFGIYREFTEIIALPVTIISVKDILDKMPHRQVVTAVLHPDNVPSVLCRLPEMIYILFLLQTEAVPARYLISHYLDIGEFIYKIPEIVLL